MADDYPLMSAYWEDKIPAFEKSRVHYDARLGKATFDITFEEETELTGYMKLHLWVEADGSDDMDLFVAIQKLDPKGKWLPTNVLGVPHAGTPGKLRVEVMGHYERIDWFEPFDWDTRNKGRHIIHTGGRYDSYLLVPYIPPKYVAPGKIYC